MTTAIDDDDPAKTASATRCASSAGTITASTTTAASTRACTCSAPAASSPRTRCSPSTRRKAVWIGWVGAWISRQIGHFFFEPKGYDAVNAMTHQEKEDVKIGYNLTRKVMLFCVFLAAPLVLYLSTRACSG